MNEEPTATENGQEPMSDLDRAEPALLREEQQRPTTRVNGKLELILPNDKESLTDSAQACFEHLATTGKFFVQGKVIVELKETAEGRALEEVDDHLQRQDAVQGYFPQSLHLRL